MARRLGVWTATTGSLVQLNNDSMRITVRVYDVASERELSTATVAVSRDSALTEAFDALGQEILEVAGAPPTAVVDMEPPTHSIDAYRAYIDGMLARNRFDLDSAQVAFRRAVDEDPQFALAYYALSAVSSGVQVPSQDPEYLALADSALRYSANRPTKERLLIEAFHAFVNADLVRAQALYRELVAMDSTLVDAWAGLGSSATFDLTLRLDADGNEYFPSSPTVALRSFSRTLELDASDYRAYPIMTSLLIAASQEEGRLPAFRDPPPGDLTTLGRRVPVEWYQIILQGDSLLTVPVDSVDVRFPPLVLDSLRRAARQRAEDLLQRWVSHAPDQGVAWLTLASVQHEEKKHDEAFASLEEAQRVGLPSVIPYEVLRLAWLLEALRLEEALPLADSLAGAGWGSDMEDQHLVRSMPFPNALIVAGRIEAAVALDRRRRALQHQFPAGPDIKARYELVPVITEVRARAAVDQVSPSLMDWAMDSLEAVAARLDDSARVQFLENLGGALLPGAAALGDTARITAFRAEYDTDRYLAIDAWAAVVAGDMALAEASYQTALQDTTWTPLQVFPLARTAEALGRHDEALAHYTAMDTLNYSAEEGTDTDFLLLVRSYALRAAVYDATGDREAAKNFYRKFLALWQDPEDGLRGQRDLARQALGELERQDRRDN
jgi:tetratricopeptide (TPR) repeat protein